MEKVLSAYTFSAAGEVFPFFLNSITQYKQYTVTKLVHVFYFYCEKCHAGFEPLQKISMFIIFYHGGGRAIAVI